MNTGLGELAAFGTAIGWAISSYVHGQVGRMVGATGVTLLRIPFQLSVLGFMTLVFGGASVPNATTLLWILGSSVTGIVLSDFLLYKTMTIIGPQLSLLLLSLSAPFTALIGWIFLGEAVSLQLASGIGLCLLGIAIVLGDRNGGSLYPGQDKPSPKAMSLGVVLGTLAALFLAINFIAWKSAMSGDISPLWATFVRLVLAALILWGAGLFNGWSAKALRNLRFTPGVLKRLLGATLFSSAGMWGAGIAMNLAPAGVAATIIGLQPVLVTVLAAAANKRLPSAKSLGGALIAFTGTALVCLR